MWTLPLSKDMMEQMYDTMLNAVITILAIYYMTGCTKSLNVFRCQVKEHPTPACRSRRLYPHPKARFHS